MTIEELKTKTKDEVFSFIRERLAFKSDIASQLRHYPQRGDADVEYVIKFNELEHRRFEMSGYDNGKTGSCAVHNINILNEFADLGLYDKTHYLFLDFYKGTPTLYLKRWGEETDLVYDEWSGFGTVEIIYNILKLTVLSNIHPSRRRD